jgi:hypothetical protein
VTGSPTVEKAVMALSCNGEEVEVAPTRATRALLLSADQFRPFQYYKGQQHFPGRYYSATERCHIGYESRLEWSCALMADFSRDVYRVISQPFRLRARVDGRPRRYTADYLLFGTSGLTVIEVKPAVHLNKPKVQATIAWVREVVEDAGWVFKTFSEPDKAVLANVQFFAGYRRPESVHPEVLCELRTHDLCGMSFAGAVDLVDGPAPRVRAALLHMLWRQEVCIDLSRPLAAGTLLEPGASS